MGSNFNIEVRVVAVARLRDLQKCDFVGAFGECALTAKKMQTVAMAPLDLPVNSFRCVTLSRRLKLVLMTCRSKVSPSVSF